MYVRFTIPTTRAIGWILSYATRGFNFEVTYPKDLGFLPFCFLNSNYEEKSLISEGSYKVSSKNWYLPNEGIVLQLYPKS